MRNVFNMKNNQKYSYLDHLEELRIRLLIIILVICILLPVCWCFSQELIDWLWNTASPVTADKMVYTKPMELFFVRLKISFILSIGIGSPVIVWHIVKFFAPALYANERFVACVLSFLSIILFAMGAALALIVIYPMILHFSYSMQSMTTIALLSVSSCIDLACWLMLGFGVCFQLPILTFFMVKIQVINITGLIKLRPYVIVFIFIIAALFTPPDIVSQLTMALPTWLLFEVSILLIKVMFKNTGNLKK